MLFIAVLIAAYGLSFLYPSSKTKFTLEVADGKSSLIYSCDDLSSEAQTLVRAEQAHAYLQNQISIISKLHARMTLDAMSVANETGDLSDLEAVNGTINKQRRELVREVDRMFDCLPIGDEPS